MPARKPASAKKQVPAKATKGNTQRYFINTDALDVLSLLDIDIFKPIVQKPAAYDETLAPSEKLHNLAYSLLNLLAQKRDEMLMTYGAKYELSMSIREEDGQPKVTFCQISLDQDGISAWVCGHSELAFGKMASEGIILEYIDVEKQKNQKRKFAAAIKAFITTPEHFDHNYEQCETIDRPMVIKKDLKSRTAVIEALWHFKIFFDELDRLITNTIIKEQQLTNQITQRTMDE